MKKLQLTFNKFTLRIKFNQLSKFKKMLFLSFPILLLLSPCIAQESKISYDAPFQIGLKAGYNQSNIIFADNDVAVRWEPISQPHYGVSAILNFSKKIGLQSELIFNRVGFTTKPLIDLTQYYNTIDIPIMLRIKYLTDSSIFGRLNLSDQFKASFSIGPYYKIFRNVVYKGSEEKIKAKMTELPDMATSTWGLIGIASSYFSLRDSGNLEVQMGAQISLKDIDKSETDSQITLASTNQNL